MGNEGVQKALISCAIAIAILLAGLSSVQCPKQDGMKRTKISQNRHQPVPLPWEWIAEKGCCFVCSWICCLFEEQ